VLVTLDVVQHENRPGASGNWAPPPANPCSGRALAAAGAIERGLESEEPIAQWCPVKPLDDHVHRQPINHVANEDSPRNKASFTPDKYPASAHRRLGPAIRLARLKIPQVRPVLSRFVPLIPERKDDVNHRH
jgi:hypothetical protein